MRRQRRDPALITANPDEKWGALLPHSKTGPVRRKAPFLPTQMEGGGDGVTCLRRRAGMGTWSRLSDGANGPAVPLTPVEAASSDRRRRRRSNHNISPSSSDV
ncbi:hypothetical protein BHM03_00007646 [Ensete ventricosum]|nr:hypothetical protein BHM03_00007646 [Ensete ventricosum]